MQTQPNNTASSSQHTAGLNLFQLNFDAPEFFRIFSASEFPEPDARKWVDARWTMVIQVCTLYVITIFAIRWAMRNRQPFNLFVPLNAWNAFLAVFSIMGTLKLTPEFFSVLYRNGFQASYCNTFEYTQGNHGFWVWLFIVSKMFELVDTIFLVLRKRPLLFLHWYHHILTMAYAFYSYPITPGFNRWGIYLNYFVHSFMYSYYFLRSMKIRVPGPVAKFITSIQIWQFIISVAILAHLGWIVYGRNVQCDLEDRVFGLATFMDITYLILFINFFVKSYVSGGGKSKYRSGKKAKDETDGNESTSNGKARYERDDESAIRRRQATAQG